MKIGLREKKRSQKKIDVFLAFTKRMLANELFSEISIKEVCEEVELSEASFYNYFPHKTDLYRFMVKLWQLKVFKDAINKSKGKRGIASIQVLINQIVDSMRDNNEVMINFAENLPRSIEEHDSMVPTDYELELAYPSEFEEIIEIKNKTIKDHISENLIAAIELDEVPAKTDLTMVGLSLVSILVGGAVVTKQLPSNVTKKLIKQNIETYLKGLRK